MTTKLAKAKDQALNWRAECRKLKKQNAALWRVANAAQIYLDVSADGSIWPFKAKEARATLQAELAAVNRKGSA
jgi:hypothetical protein